MPRTRFEFVEFNDPAFTGMLLPAFREMLERAPADGLTPETYVREIAAALFSKGPVKVYLLLDKKTGEVAALAIFSISGIPPRIWIEAFYQAKKFAKYKAAEHLWKKVEEEIKKSGVKEVYCMVRRPAAVKLFMKKAGFVPKEIVLRKKY